MWEDMGAIETKYLGILFFSFSRQKYAGTREDMGPQMWEDTGATDLGAPRRKAGLRHPLQKSRVRTPYWLTPTDRGKNENLNIEIKNLKISKNIFVYNKLKILKY